jgi:hypothetical protein
LAVGTGAGGVAEVCQLESVVVTVVRRAAAARGAGRGGMRGRSEGGTLQVEMVVLGLVGER